MSILKNFFGDDSLTDDKYMANTMMDNIKFAATAYFAGTLESATPEVRNLYSSFCNDLIKSHEDLVGLSIKKGWYSAYGDPKTQLESVVKDSMKVISPNA